MGDVLNLFGYKPMFEKVMTLSSRHLSSLEFKKLSKVAIASSKQGDRETCLLATDSHVWDDASQEANVILKVAKENNADLIFFDSDGPEVGFKVQR